MLIFPLENQLPGLYRDFWLLEDIIRSRVSEGRVEGYRLEEKISTLFGALL